MLTSNQLGSLLDDLVPKTFFDGTHRSASPDETLSRIRHLLPVMGITRVANVTGLDFIGIPVVTVCRPNSRSLAVHQGKGLTLASARASGLMESIETYHAENIDQPLVLRRYAELACYRHVVEISALPLARNTRFNPNLDLLWIEGYDLLQHESIFVPYELVHTNFTLPRFTGSGCFSQSSNGLASGNVLLEAISHAICEVVERDATALWSLQDDKEQQVCQVDINTVDDPPCREILERYKEVGIRVAVWDITSNIGLPVFYCTIGEEAANSLPAAFLASGAGCHPTRRIALLRALTEAAQSRLTAISGSRDDLYRSDYARVSNRDVLLQETARLSAIGPLRDFRMAPTFEGTSFNDDVVWELTRLNSAGVNRVIAFDLTRRGFGIPVVRIVIPGLEGYSSGPDYVPGARARARNGGAA